MSGWRLVPKKFTIELTMHRFLPGRMIVVLLSCLIFYFGIAGLKSGEIRSRGYKFKREESPFGYWGIILITLAGSLATIYLMLTR